MEKYEIVKYSGDFSKRIDELSKVIKPVEIQRTIEKLEKVMLEDDFWQDSSSATKTINECNAQKEKLAAFNNLKKLSEDLETIVDLDDPAFYNEAESLIKEIEKHLNDFETVILLNGECDHLPCILEIHPGAGGTESQDWALMLFRMYKRFAENKGFKFSVLDYLEANDAGIKSVTCLVEGKNAYGLLQAERGVHRLVRISPFDSSARRHTSFAAVNITPQIDEEVEVTISPEDIRIDTYRSSGAGGQHVNTTDSAVRITHIPTNIVVSCQNERSQIQNKETAFKVLKAKLYQLKLDEKNEYIKDTVGGNLDNAFGSQIRSYVLHPYSMVKDHRTGEESSNPVKVLDGELDTFINAYLKFKAGGK